MGNTSDIDNDNNIRKSFAIQFKLHKHRTRPNRIEWDGVELSLVWKLLQSLEAIYLKTSVLFCFSSQQASVVVKQ